MKKFLVAIVLVAFTATGCATTCAEKGNIWKNTNSAVVDGLYPFVEKKIGPRAPDWKRVVDDALETARKEYVARCLEKESSGDRAPETPAAPPAGEGTPGAGEDEAPRDDSKSPEAKLVVPMDDAFECEIALIVE